MNLAIVGKITFLLSYLLFLAFSYYFDFETGKTVGFNLYTFAKDMLAIVPCAFILIGLFEVWVKKETVEKHLGDDSNIMGYFWMILLAGTSVGGLYVAFPLAYSLFKKGARLSMIFTYIGAASVCRIPMTIFEASFMGLKFTLIRLFVSLPLIIIAALIMEKVLKKQKYQIVDGHQKK